jgi:hypothetical protein
VEAKNDESVTVVVRQEINAWSANQMKAVAVIFNK